MRKALTAALVGDPGRLSMPRGGVARPQGLGQQTRFGSLNPSIVTGNRFSGGVVPGAQNMVHPEPPPTFQAPRYASMGSPGMVSHPLAPILAALVGATGAGAGAPGPTGVTPPPGPTIGPSTGTRYPAGWWNPETNPVAPWSKPGDPVSTVNSPTSGELKPVRSGTLAQKISPYGSNYIKAQ
jgi:hypothetical protein